MLEQLQQIDTGVIDDLIAIKREREVVANRLARMEAEKSKVSEVVYERVRRDYAAKAAELEQLATPLKQRGRAEFVKLRALLDQLESEHAATRLDQEEMQFRRDLGEFEPAEFDRRVGELAAKLESQAAQLAQAGAVRDRFVEAFDSEAELAAATPPLTPAVAAAPAAAALPAPPEAAGVPRLRAVLDDERDVVPVMPRAVLEADEMPPAMDTGRTAPQPVMPPEEPSSQGPPPFPAPAPPDGTVILGSDGAPAAPRAMDTAAAPAPAPPSAPLPPTVPAMPHAMASTPAKLIAVDEDLGASEFPLRALTFIGRTPDNQIRLNKPAISRRHAQLSLSDQGWVLKDLHSESGSYVNGERIQERTLADGDRVQIGTVRFTFRST